MLIPLHQHHQGRILHISDATHVQYHHPGLILCDQLPDPGRDMLHIDEKEAPLRTKNEQPRKGLIIGMTLRQGAQDILSGFTPDHIDPGLGRLTRQAQQRGQDGHHNALQGADRNGAK